MPELAGLDELLGLGRLRGLGQELQYAGPERRRRRRYRLLDPAPQELEDELLERLRAAPAESTGGRWSGALQSMLDILDLPRNAVMNLFNLAVGAQARTRQKGVFGLPRISAGDILEKVGLQAPAEWGKAGRVVDVLADFLGNVALDPLNWATLGTTAVFGSAGRKVGQAILRPAGEKALGTALSGLEQRLLRRGTEKALAAGAEKAAARQAGREALETAFERAGAKAIGGAVEGVPTRPLGREYLRERGREIIRENVAERLIRTRPELADPNWLGWTTRGLKQFHPLDLPALLAGGAMRMLAPRALQKVAPVYGALRRATLPVVNPLSWALPEVSGTIISRELAQRIGKRLGLGRLGSAVRSVPGAGPVLEGVRRGGEELRELVSTKVRPPRPGDAEDRLRYEVQRWEKFARERTARRGREVAYTEVPWSLQRTQAAMRASGLPEETVNAVAYDVSEALHARDSLENIAVRVRRIVTDAGGTPQQAEKLARFVPEIMAGPTSAATPAPALAPAAKGEFGELWHDRPPTAEPDLFGDVVEQRPQQGGLFRPAELERARLAPKPRAEQHEAIEIGDGLRQMVASVLREIPGGKIPNPQIVRAALIERYGSAAVQSAMRRRLHGVDWEPEIAEAIDQAEKGLRLFAPGTEGVGERAARAELAVGDEVRASYRGKVYQGRIASISPTAHTAILVDAEGKTIGNLDTHLMGKVPGPRPGETTGEFFGRMHRLLKANPPEGGPALAPGRTIGERVSMTDQDLNDYTGTLDVVDLKHFGSKLLASHRPETRAGKLLLVPVKEYPAGFQARAREAEASVQQVAGITATPKYELLLEFSPDVTTGPPVVWRPTEGDLAGVDLVVQGNGRIAGMKAWTADKWQAYRAELEKIVGPLPAELKKPILVRRLEGTAEQARMLAARGQQSATLRQTRIERARAALQALGADPETIPSVRMKRPVTRENVPQFLAENKPFADWLLGKVPPQRRAQIEASTEELAERVNDALLAMLPRTVQDLPVRAGWPEKMERMLVDLAPPAAYLHSLRRQGVIRPEYDPYPALENAAALWQRLRGKRGSYAAMVDELDRIAATPTFAGMEDVLSGATRRGVALAIGLERASRAADPSRTVLESMDRVIAAALADDPKQMGLMALDPGQTAAEVYGRAFLPEATARGVLAKMEALPTREGVAGAQTQPIVSDLREAGVSAQPGAAEPGAPVAPRPGGGEPAEKAIAEIPRAGPTPDRARFYADLDAHWASAAGDPTELPAIKLVLDRMHDERFAGLRFAPGSTKQAAAIRQKQGRVPAAAYFQPGDLEPGEQAVLNARGLIRLFQRSEQYDDLGFLLEELSHHGYYAALSDAERAVIQQVHAERSPGEWAAIFRERGVRPAQADYYAAQPLEWFGRLETDYIMGRELAGADPAVRSLFGKVLAFIRDVWHKLIDAGELRIGTDKRIAQIIEAHYTPPAQRLDQALGLGRLEPIPALPAGARQQALFPPLELGVVAGAGQPPPPGAKQLAFGAGEPLGRPGRLELADPIREMVQRIQGRSELRILEQHAADVPARRLSTEREIQYVRRMLGDRKTALGRWQRSRGMSTKAASQLLRLRDREKFVSEINEEIVRLNEIQRGQRAGSPAEIATLNQIGLESGEQLTPYLADPMLAHVARELESVRTIGSAEMIHGLVDMFGMRVIKGKPVPPGYVFADAKQFGDLLRGVALRPEAAAALEQHVKQWQRPSWLLGKYRQLLNLWKGWALFAPAYQLRNLFGDAFNAGLAEAYSGPAWSEGMQIVQAVGRGAVVRGAPELRRRIEGTNETWGTLYRKLAVDYGKIGSGFFGVEFSTHRNQVQRIIEMIRHPESGRRALAELKGGHPLRFNATLASMAEDASKLGFVITRLRKGDDLALAVDKMVKHLFDYSDLTQFERGTATRPGLREIIPFYTWTRKNAELLLTVALTEPGKLALIPKIQLVAERTLAGEETLPYSLRPPHIAKEAGVQISGGLKPKFLNLGYMLPIGELASINIFRPRQMLGRWAEQVAGPARTAAELVANYDPFFGRKIREYPGQRREFLGVPMAPEVKHVLRTIRPLNFAEQMRQMARASETPAGAAAGVAALTTGVRAFPVDVPRQIYEAERRLNDQLGAVRRDIKRRLAELGESPGADPLADSTLRRLAVSHEELIRQRDALPVAETRRMQRPERRSRQERFQAYLEELRTQRIAS